MRRSLGVGAAEAPRRVRQSQEFQQGGQGSASRPSRPRSSINPGASGGSRASGSQSRLPVLQAAGAKGKQGQRSSSSGGPMTERHRNTMATPRQGGAVKRTSSGTRSSDRQTVRPRVDYQTPQRNPQSGRKSLAPGASTAGKRLSGRGSQVGAKAMKDTRPLQDKEFQKTQTINILDFLRQTAYPNTGLTSKHFPLAGREFVGVFNHIYSHIDPRPGQEEVLVFPGFHETIKTILADLKYPGNIPRSHFVTLGSQHSWPAVLGCLSYLCDLATTYCNNIQPSINAIGFPGDFDSDRETREKLHYEHHLKCFAVFNVGHDDYSEQLEELHGELLDNMGVDVDRLARLEQQASALQQEAQQVEGRGNKVEELREITVAQQTDIAKMTEYLQRKVAKNHEKKEDGERLGRQVEEVRAEVEGLQVQADALRASSEQAKVSSYEAERLKALITEKRTRLEAARADVDEVDKEIFEKELLSSKLVGALDDLAKQANSLALQEDVRSRDGELIALPKARFIKEKDGAALPPGFKQELGELVRVGRAEGRQREKELAGHMEDVARAREAILARRRDLEAQRVEGGKLQEEVAEVREVLRKGEEALDQQVAAVREELHQLRRQDRGGLAERRRELEVAVERCRALATERREKREEGQRFLEDVMGMAVSHMEEAIQHRDRASAVVLAQARRNVAVVREAAAAVETQAAAAIQARRDRR